MPLVVLREDDDKVGDVGDVGDVGVLGAGPPPGAGFCSEDAVLPVLYGGLGGRSPRD